MIRLVAFLLLFGSAVGQTPQMPAGEAPVPMPPAGTTVLNVGTQLVVVDVVVKDKDGHPVHGLKKENFSLLEDKSVQTIRNFEEHTADAPVEKTEPLPKQAPGVFTNYTDVPSNGTLNVLLLDNLNTPVTQQAYVLHELKTFVEKSQPGSRIAIFGLSSKLYFLQGFTSDPTILKNVVEHKLLPKGSALLDDSVGSNGDNLGPSGPALDMGTGPGEIAFNMSNFEVEQQTLKTLMRMEYTLDAFNVLGHYLAAFPGRKNLIWFSSSFPLAIVPDITLADPFAVMGGDMEAEYRQTTNLLTHAQVAIYPVAAEGLASDPTLDSAMSGAGFKNPHSFSTSMSSFVQSQAQEHQTMMAIAEDTGGDAYFNTNDLAAAVSKAITDGSNYYTLTYTPHEEKNKDYRAIKVELSPSAAPKGVKLSYRQGYYADTPATTSNKASATNQPSGENRLAYSYTGASMSRGAPAPVDIVFRARVLPASTSTETSLAPGNKPNPKIPFNGPYKRYDIDIVAPGENFSFKVLNNGDRVGGVEFLAYVFDADGRLLNTTGKDIDMHHTAEEQKKFRAGNVGFHLEVDAPAKGESFIRIGVHDLTTDTFGVVEVPTSAVEKLAPPVYPKR